MAATTTGRLRSFGSSALKLAISLTLAFVALAGISTAAYWAYSYPERERAKQAEVMRVWTDDLSSNLGMKLRAKTKVTDGTMHIALNFDGYPEYLKHPTNQSRGFTLEWKDADGFTRIKKVVLVSAFSSVVNDKGQSQGLNGQFSEFVSVNDYSALASMKVGWNLETQLPQQRPAVPDSAAEVAKADHCAPGLSRQERLRRLAQHGTLRETGYNTFSAGSRTLTLSGAEVIYCG
jgi:hypothetical protein